MLLSESKTAIATAQSIGSKNINKGRAQGFFGHRDADGSKVSNNPDFQCSGIETTVSGPLRNWTMQ
jgi:hypothetical protein